VARRGIAGRKRIVGGRSRLCFVGQRVRRDNPLLVNQFCKTMISRKFGVIKITVCCYSIHIKNVKI